MQRAERAVRPALDTAAGKLASGRAAVPATQAGFADRRPVADEQRQLMQWIAQSPLTAVQRALKDNIHNSPQMQAQRAGGRAPSPALTAVQTDGNGLPPAVQRQSRSRPGATAVAQAMRGSGQAAGHKPYQYAVGSAHWAESRDDAHATGKQAVDQALCQRIYQKHRNKEHEGKCVSYFPTNRAGITLMVVSYADLRKGALTLDTAYITNTPKDPEGAAIRFDSTTQIALPVAAAVDGPIPGDALTAPLSKNQKRNAKRKARKLAQDNNIANNNNE